MKKKKLLKSASLIALSAVMMCGAAAAFAGCGTNAYQIRVSMFCGDTDVDINRKNCEDWAEQYTKKLRENGTFTEDDKDVTVDFTYQTNTDAYFDQLKTQIASGSQPDVFYVSPKYVKAWSNANRILDLSTALAKDAETLTDIWEDSLAFYSYSSNENYTSGDRIKFDGSKFVTVNDNVTVGIYGLPKDYSNFGLGFNEVFFTPEVRKALTEMTTEDRTGVHGAEYKSAEISYGGESGVVTNESGSDVPLVNIGVPTYYKPYNFYAYASYDAALLAGDPMATAVDVYTNGKGYCVTIPGWPGDTFEDAKKDKATADNPWAEVDDVTIPEDKQDANATYDTSKGYITYTYAEYSALTWVITYYVNTYDWLGKDMGGCMTNAGMKNVYGNDQYDGVLYLLPWLAGNDAQYLNEQSTNAINGSDPTKIGKETYKTTHKALNGTDEKIDIQYGVNSEKFIETVGAFHAYGSDWNGNSNNAGDSYIEKSSGWDLFVAGNCVFYGVGTWNAGALNATDRQYLRYRLMPEPVSEDFALSSYIKDEDYNMKSYVWDAGKKEATVTKNASVFAPGEYSGEDIFENQLTRQDQWGARMDSVGYGVSTSAKEGGDWREDAAIDLVRYLTITPATQVTLTYSGSQLPNFKSQCDDFYKNDGDFADMITPDPDENGSTAEWDAAYAIAKAMYAAGTASATSNTLIKDWMETNYPKQNYDKAYANDALSTLSSLAFSMKVLYMVAYKEADRDLSLRMQYGLNATRDSAMYTYNDAWIDTLDPRGDGLLMAYDQQRSFGSDMTDVLKKVFKSDNPNGQPIKGSGYGTPAWWCLHQAKAVQTALNEAIAEEKSLMS